jgi:endo-1,4-beta-xylanase
MTGLDSRSIGFARRLSRRRLVLGAALASSTASFGHRTSFAAQDESLRALAERKGFRIGALCGSGWLEVPQYADTLAREFNGVVIDGLARLDWVPPSGPVQVSYDSSGPDRIVDFAGQHDLQIGALHLVWGNQFVIPYFLLHGGYSGEELMGILRNRVRTTVTRFAGHVRWWSVVNEPFEADGSYKTGADRWGWWNDNSPWSDGIDPDYIEVAFREAHAADPNAILLLNDWDMEFLNPKSDAMYNLVARLKQKEVPIHGVGMQMHLPVPWGFPDTATLAANMRRFHDDLGVQVYITEMSIDTRGLGATRDERFAVQAEIYRSVFQAAVESGACRDLCIFGVSDKESNVANSDEESNEFLFDDDYQLKPAYFALLEELSKLPDT